MQCSHFSRTLSPHQHSACALVDDPIAGYAQAVVVSADAGSQPSIGSSCTEKQQSLPQHAALGCVAVPAPPTRGQLSYQQAQACPARGRVAWPAAAGLHLNMAGPRWDACAWLLSFTVLVCDMCSTKLSQVMPANIKMPE